ncbi:MAG: ATP synthase F1 subunit gamma [Candidatus Gastranaerophilales bacterium]|nr:ATP synthase F1 subunit gamma [Candidatus Gastranaerophilales bacterium]
MPNLKDIKSRIQSVQNTQKITKAMKMVAAAKVKKAENSVKASRPFTTELMKMFRKMLSGARELSNNGETFSRPLDNYPVLLTERKVKTAGLVVVTSNKGLAGAYNANVIRTALKKAEEYSSNGIETLLYIIGQKGVSSLRHRPDIKIAKKYIAVADNPNASGANLIAEDLAADFVEGEIDKIEIITTRFNNMMSYAVQDWTVLPLEFEGKSENIKLESLMEFTPDTRAILRKIVPMFITNSIFQALLEANASELASRMTAMSAASKNAEEMINSLTVSYNKARQGAITQELIEIVSGASAQK